MDVEASDVGGAAAAAHAADQAILTDYLHESEHVAARITRLEQAIADDRRPSTGDPAETSAAGRFLRLQPDRAAPRRKPIYCLY